MSESSQRVSSVASAIPYFALGVIICALLQIVFFVQLGGEGLSLIPFIWAYSQFSLVELLIPSAGSVTWVLQAITWFVVYVVLSLVLWTLFGRSPSLLKATAWGRAALAWIGVEVILAVMAAGAQYAGIIEME